MDSLIDFLGRAVKSIKPDLRGLTDDDLQQVRAGEKEGQDRGSLIEAIDAELASRSAAAGVKASVSGPAPVGFGGKESRGEKHPAYQHPDYSGPLTLMQAAWRNQNLTAK